MPILRRGVYAGSFGLWWGGFRGCKEIFWSPIRDLGCWHVGHYSGGFPLRYSLLGGLKASYHFVGVGADLTGSSDHFSQSLRTEARHHFIRRIMVVNAIGEPDALGILEQAGVIRAVAIARIGFDNC